MKKIIILEDGTRYPVIKSDKKYLYCDGTQFRKNHPSIERIEEEKEYEEGFDKLPDMEEIDRELEAEQKAADEAEKAEKKSASKAKKKGE